MKSNLTFPLQFDTPEAEAAFREGRIIELEKESPPADGETIPRLEALLSNSSPQLADHGASPDPAESTFPEPDSLMPIPFQGGLSLPAEADVLTTIDPQTVIRNSVQAWNMCCFHNVFSVPPPISANLQQQDKPQTQSQTAHSERLPKAQDLADKLIAMEHFALHERQLYFYQRGKGYYALAERDEVKSIIYHRLQEDLRVRGTSYQLNDIFEFIRHDSRLKVTSPPPHLLCFVNGILDLSSRTFKPEHDPQIFFTWRLAIPFNPSDWECPRFNQLLSQVAGSNPVLIQRIWEVLAYLLVPSEFQKAIILFQGDSGTGKSLFANLIASFYDSESIAHIAANQMQNRFAPFTLQGRRLNISMDLPGGRISADAVALLKQITGGDEIFVEAKGIDGRSAHLDCRFLYGTNHPFSPAIQDEAFMARVVLIPFRYPIPPAEMDHNLLDKLLPERAAIFNHALIAAERLRKNNFLFTGEEHFGIRVAALGNNQNSILERFIADVCVLDDAAFTPTYDLFTAFSALCTTYGYKPEFDTQTFSQRFNATTPECVCLTKKRFNGKPTNGYTGIALKNHSANYKFKEYLS